MNRPTEVLFALQELIDHSPWRRIHPDDVRQILAYIKNLEEKVEGYRGVVTTARQCGKTQMVQLTLDQHLKRAAQDS